MPAFVAPLFPSYACSIQHKGIIPLYYEGFYRTYWYKKHAWIQRVGQGVWNPHPEKSQNIGFLSNTGPDPLNITKLQSQHSMLGHHWHASKMLFNGVSLAGQWWPAYYSGIWILLPLINERKCFKIGPPRIRACKYWTAHCVLKEAIGISF